MDPAGHGTARCGSGDGNADHPTRGLVRLGRALHPCRGRTLFDCPLVFSTGWSITGCEEPKHKRRCPALHRGERSEFTALASCPFSTPTIGSWVNWLVPMAFSSGLRPIKDWHYLWSSFQDAVHPLHQPASVGQAAAGVAATPGGGGATPESS